MEPLRVAAREKGVTLRTRIGAAKTLVRSDRHLLSRVLANIIGNAIKYGDQSKPNPIVLVGVVNLPNRARIDIIDNGIGIPRQHWEDVFKPFFQVGNAERDREKGLGLGLSIVKSSMQLLKEHRIEMRSIEGRGTRFSLDIPRSAEVCERTISRRPRETAIMKDIAGLYVIYVEDDALVRASTEALFQEYGILYEAIASMQELKDRLAVMERVPDLVITDHRLPGSCTARNIIDVISAHMDAGVPVIILTGEVTTSLMEFTEAQVLAKPVAPEALLAAIAASCQSQRDVA
jgi:CheY-like chemotaxis protein